VSAGAIIAAIPPILLFFAMQRQFVAGLTLGAARD
jgi:multiple sugar transport system permease protein